MYQLDRRVVVTLDAGGHNLIFSAIRGNSEVAGPICLPYPQETDDLDKRLRECMGLLVDGFGKIIDQLYEKPAAISFAFPGPADYLNGVIGPGYLINFPEFREGVALGPFLEEKFGVPVFINNDGDLFAYGEALSGVLPDINRRLAEAGSPKRYRNLIGYTFGTGFGVGLVSDGRLHLGDNACVETACLRHKKMPGVIVEEGVSIRALKRIYDQRTGGDFRPEREGATGLELAVIACGRRPGDSEAARLAYAELGEVAGDAMATCATLYDGIIVIGGGLTGSADLFMPALLTEMRSQLATLGGEKMNRVHMKVYNLDDEEEFRRFATGDTRVLNVYGSGKTAICEAQKRIGVTISKIGAPRAISLGACCYALSRLDNR